MGELGGVAGSRFVEVVVDKKRIFRPRNLIGFGLVVYIAASFGVAEYLIRPRPSNPQTPNDPRVLVESVSLTAEDGVSLEGTVGLTPDGDAVGVVLLFHGISASRRNHELAALAERKLHGVAIDFRAHGKSGGRRTSFGYLESYDVRAAYRYARRRWPELPIAASGISMGAAALIYAQDVSSELAGVVFESVYATIDEAFEHRLTSRLPRFLAFLGQGPKWAVEWRLGLQSSEMRPIDYLGDRFRGERLRFLTGAVDPWATVDEMKRLAAKVPGSETVVVDGADHNDLAAKAGSRYGTLVYDFLLERCKAVGKR